MRGGIKRHLFFVFFFFMFFFSLSKKLIWSTSKCSLTSLFSIFLVEHAKILHFYLLENPSAIVVAKVLGKIGYNSLGLMIFGFLSGTSIIWMLLQWNAHDNPQNKKLEWDLLQVFLLSCWFWFNQAHLVQLFLTWILLLCSVLSSVHFLPRFQVFLLHMD